MNLCKRFKNNVLYIKKRLTENSLDNLLWIVNIFPRAAGFSIFEKSLWVPFWIIKVTILLHGNGVGSIDYQLKHAETVSDYIKSNFNIIALILDLSNSWCFCMKRTVLTEVLKEITLSERLARESGLFNSMHEHKVKIIKRIFFLFYGINLINVIFIYMPNSVTTEINYYRTPCIGFGSLTKSPNREICLIFLALEDIFVVAVVLNFQALLLLLIAHTAAMYQMLASEILILNETEDSSDVKLQAKEKIPTIFRRHILTLGVINKLKSLYSMPLGINFGTNAITICMFFYVPLKGWFEVLPMLMYTAMLFFLYCYLCQWLVNASEEFESAVYCCGWENFDLKEKQLVHIMLRQAHKPIQILAANMIPVNIYTFASTLQFVFKFVTVVKI